MLDGVDESRVVLDAVEVCDEDGVVVAVGCLVKETARASKRSSPRMAAIFSLKRAIFLLILVFSIP